MLPSTSDRIGVPALYVCWRSRTAALTRRFSRPGRSVPPPANRSPSSAVARPPARPLARCQPVRRQVAAPSTRRGGSPARPAHNGRSSQAAAAYTQRAPRTSEGPAAWRALTADWPPAADSDEERPTADGPPPRLPGRYRTLLFPQLDVFLPVFAHRWDYALPHIGIPMIDRQSYYYHVELQ